MEPSNGLILQNDIYVTQQGKFLDIDDQTDEKGVFQDSEETDTCTTIHRGLRPNVSTIISRVEEEAKREGWGRIFVMGCGPVSLLEELEVACRKTASKEVEIDYHQEIFDY